MMHRVTDTMVLDYIKVYRINCISFIGLLTLQSSYAATYYIT